MVGSPLVSETISALMFMRVNVKCAHQCAAATGDLFPVEVSDEHTAGGPVRYIKKSGGGRDDRSVSFHGHHGALVVRDEMRKQRRPNREPRHMPSLMAFQLEI